MGKECGGNIEDKDTAMTWHFFHVPPSEEAALVEKASEIVRKNGFPVLEGHGCIEVLHHYLSLKTYASIFFMIDIMMFIYEHLSKFSSSHVN